jgi:hypothetical protein
MLCRMTSPSLRTSLLVEMSAEKQQMSFSSEGEQY